MSRFQSIEDLEKGLKEQDVQGGRAEYLKNHIGSLSRGKRKPMKLRLTPILVWILLIAVTTGFAVIGTIELKNRNGKVSFFYTKQGDEWIATDAKADKIREKYNSIEQKLKKTIKPGEYMYFGIVDIFKIYEEIGSTAICDILQTEKIYKDMDSLMKATTTKLRTPGYIPVGFNFSQGQIDYNELDKVDAKAIQKLYEEAKRQDRGYFYLIGKTSKEMNGMWLHYQSSQYKNELRLMIRQGFGMFGAKAFSSEEKSVKLTIAGREALMIDDRNKEVLQIYVPDDSSGRKLIYEYEFQREEALKKEVLKMIEDMFGERK